MSKTSKSTEKLLAEESCSPPCINIDDRSTNIDHINDRLAATQIDRGEQPTAGDRREQQQNPNSCGQGTDTTSSSYGNSGGGGVVPGSVLPPPPPGCVQLPAGVLFDDGGAGGYNDVDGEDCGDEEGENGVSNLQDDLHYRRSIRSTHHGVAVDQGKRYR